MTDGSWRRQWVLPDWDLARGAAAAIDDAVEMALDDSSSVSADPPVVGVPRRQPIDTIRRTVMPARAKGRCAGRGATSSRLTVLVAALVVPVASMSCGGTEPSAMTDGPASAAASTVAPTALETGEQTPAPINWEIGEAPGDVRDVVSTGAFIVAVGVAAIDESGDTAGIWTSIDGAAWEPAQVAQPSGTVAAVAIGRDRLVAVGTVFQGTSRPAAWTSVDGRIWQALPASAFVGAQEREPGALADVAAGVGGFVAVGSEVGAGGHRAAAWHSTDGLSWTRSPSDLGGDSAGAVVPRDTGYVASGWSPGDDGDARAMFWSSPDGQTWTAAPDDSDLHGVASDPAIAATQQHLVAVGYPAHQWAVTDPLVWTSQDGVTWQRDTASALTMELPDTPDPGSGPPSVASLAVGGLIGTDDGFAAAGAGIVLTPGSGASVVRRVVWSSQDGAAWSLVADLPDPQAGSGADGALVGPLVAHQGRLLVFGKPTGAGPAPLWEADLRGLLHPAS